MHRLKVLSWPLLLAAAIAYAPAHSQVRTPRVADEAIPAVQQGNWAEAYDQLRDRLLERRSPDGSRGDDLKTAVDCLMRLGRVSEADAFVQQVLEVYPDDPRVLYQAALAYQNLPHHGAMVAGEFQRGNPRGAARVVNSFRRDRVRSIQLLVRAVEADGERPESLFMELADVLMGARFRNQAWRLQLLTDLAELPDFDEGWAPSAGTRGAPVDRDGNPIFYQAPQTWDDAKNDGERWRWALEQFGERGPYEKNRALAQRAQFLQEQFGVQTLAQIAPLLARAADEDGGEPGTFALHTLGEDETIAQLAIGARRFELPDEHNHIKLYQQILENDDGQRNRPQAEQAAVALAGVFENRRQYPRAAEYWRLAIEHSSGRSRDRYRQSLEQVVGSWAEFGPVDTQPAGEGATVDFRFRNGESVEFVARRFDVQQLLADVKDYLKSNPRQLDWRRVQVTDIGNLMIQTQGEKYLVEEAARWTLQLDPPAGHFDKRITVTTPLQAPGAYVLTANIEGGPPCKIILWIADTAIVRKPLDGEQLYYVADARGGRPIAGANLELFGFRQERTGDGPNDYRIDTTNFAQATDAEGLARVRLNGDEQRRSTQWLAIATTADGRHAYWGFDGLGWPRLHRGRYDQAKAYVVTDRPVYRPGQTVHFKAWVQRATYGGTDDGSEFAHQSFRVELIDGRNEKVHTASLTANAYGGLEGEYELPEGATLGAYRLNVVGQGAGSFRVEEYKKPEYEVTVEAPEETVKLGDKFTAKVRATYYFGSPVVNATVKYKVTRTTHDEPWFPPRPWDWLYGPGYWWFAPTYDWYPGWSRWGCPGPVPPWIWRPQDPPEVVAEGEAPIGPDGSIEVPIDTALAKELHPDEDHSYHIEAQVVDESRRTVVGGGDVLVARKPFRAFVWLGSGHYRVGDTVEVGVATRSASGEAVARPGTLRLLKLDYPGDGTAPNETEVRQWELATDADGRARQQFRASEPGQYRLSYQAPAGEGETVEAGHVFTITGAGFDGSGFTFNDLEVIPDKREYQPGDKVQLQVNTNRVNSTVLLFVRPENGVYTPPRVVHVDGKSALVEVDVAPSDMPNLLVEAVTIAGAQQHDVLKDIPVPPVKRVLNVELAPSSSAYKPGQEATVKLRLTDVNGEPFVGETALTVYDKSVEYISGGSNAPDIRKFFWDWKHTHYPNGSTSLAHSGRNLVPEGERGMNYLGVFGQSVPDELGERVGRDRGGRADAVMLDGMAPAAAAPMAMARSESASESSEKTELVEPTVRTEFADTAYWDGSLETNSDGIAEIEFAMPENLTTWKVSAWAMGHGARVGHGSAEVVTRKNLLVRLQTPRFLVERDEAVFSANVHNYLGEDKEVTVRLELEGKALEAPSQMQRKIRVPAGGDQRVDWRVKAIAEGDAVARALALTDEESDAMQVETPVRVHGIEQMNAYSGVIALDERSGAFEIDVPSDRRPEQTRLVVEYSPTIAGAMVDALPYLIDYPHGCTEQTLNRFLPAVVTQRTLQRMDVDLAAVREKRANLNPQQLGDPQQRREGWRQFKRNPVFDPEELKNVVDAGLRRLTDMQLDDGGWGWFSGSGARSSAHTTAIVVRGLLIAQENDVAVVPSVLERGVEWLDTHQDEQLEALRNAQRGEDEADERKPKKEHADNLDALVHLVLTEAGRPNGNMRDFLYRDRLKLAPYGLAMLGVALELEGGQDQERDMVLRNLKQYVVTDHENQTAYLRLPNEYWWYWYGSEYEAHAFFLKLLAAVEPESDLASGLVKYLLNNRAHATYWNSTRDTALVVEAMADYLAATDQGEPDQTVEVWLDGEKRKEVGITGENLFSFDGALEVEGAALEAGRHTIELRRRGEGRLYYNAYLTNFTTEDDIPAAGLEVRVRRDVYKLEPVEASEAVAGGRGQAVEQRVTKYERRRVSNLASVRSGDLLEIELTLESKNDYEYLIVTDHKAAGFEPVDLRSGYTGNELGAYVEYRDEVVNMYLDRLPRGERSVTYRVRAETPGLFSALPTLIEGMYAPELKGNSDEIKVRVRDEG